MSQHNQKWNLLSGKITPAIVFISLLVLIVLSGRINAQTETHKGNVKYNLDNYKAMKDKNEKEIEKYNSNILQIEKEIKKYEEHLKNNNTEKKMHNIFMMDLINLLTESDIINKSDNPIVIFSSDKLQLNGKLMPEEILTEAKKLYKKIYLKDISGQIVFKVKQ